MLEHMRAGVLLHLECIEEGLRSNPSNSKGCRAGIAKPPNAKINANVSPMHITMHLNVFGEFQRSRVDNMKKKMEKERERIQEKKRRIVFFYIN